MMRGGAKGKASARSKVSRISARSRMSTRSSVASRSSDMQSWIMSRGRRSVGRAHGSFSLHTRVGKVLADDRQNAFDPNARAVKLWDQALLLCLLLEAFVLPYFISFQPEVVGVMSTFFVLVVVCDFVFAIDLLVQAHMGYYSDGNLIRDKKRTIRRYVRSPQFALDFIATVPTQALVIGYPKLVNELLFLKLLRWSRLPHLVSSVDEFYAKHFVVLKLLKVLVSTVYLAHVLACVRYIFGEDHSHTDPWLPKALSHGHSLHRDYLMSLFWSVGIMTGLFEGELPRHSSEFLFTILVSLCGFSMFTTLCATIFVISKCESGNAEAMSARINQLVHVLSFHHVPESQQNQAIEYLKRYYTDAESTDRETAKILCPSIANDIQVELLKSTLAQISLFVGCNDQFIVAMTSLLELTAVPAQTTLFSEGDHGSAMYVVRSGVLAVVARSVTVLEMRKGTCFGELFVFSSMPCTATVISTTYAILYKLSRFHCERVLEGYPDCASVIAVHVKDILRQLNISEDESGSNTSYNSISSRSNSRRAALRRASVTTGGIASALARVRGASRGSSFLSSQRISISRKQSKKNSIGPLLQDLPQPGIKPVNVEHLSRDTRTDTTTMSTDDLLSHTLTTNNDHEPPPFEQRQGPKLKLVYKHHGLWRLILLQRCIDFDSPARMWWLLLLFSNLCYCWIMVPVQVIFPLWQRPSWVTQSIDSISNIGLLLDLVLNLNLAYMIESDKVMDPKLSALRYLRTGFRFDLLCALPYEYLHMEAYGLMRLPRLLRVFHLRRHLKELDHFIQLNSRRQLVLLILLFFMMFHVVACIYFAISYLEGFDPNENEAWVCPTSLCLRRLNATHFENCDGVIFDENLNRRELGEIAAMEYFRSLYYAVGVLASPGKTVEPTSDVQLVAALILMLGGFLISGVVVDNVQKRFTASAFEQKQFFETSTRIQLFLRRQKAPLAIHHRVKSFLDYWWSSHRGAVLRDLLADLPRSMRLELLRSICTPVLQTLALLQGVHPVRDKLEEVMVENASFILYGQGETVYRHGDYVSGMYFVLEGEVCVVKMGGPPSKIHRGGYFGTAILTQQERGEGYLEHVSANSGCILLFVSRDQLRAMEAIFPPLKSELLTVDQRLMSSELACLHVQTDREEHNQVRSLLHRVQISLKSVFTAVYDPDSLFTLAWETWLFMVMTTQWVLVMFQACFRLDGGHKNVDSLMVFLECSFLLDVFIRSRLGFYEYGNKVMDIHRIKHQYFRSGTFALDIVALLPLYAVNWGIESYQRWDLLNVNKLLRLFKVPKQLHALETRYLKRTTELHLFKLLYYTFMLSHILGCIWFNFASGVAIPKFSDSATSSTNQTAFGENLWLPSKKLENGSLMLQYMASLYWSFGLMSSSGESEYPQTTAQCIFSIVTMTAGVFLFAYVIGNFTDIIELTSSESREFNVKMGAARQMLHHFKIPSTLQERVKTFLLFKRYHTITQEHLLGECLPPSLLTDIRLVYLKPMIEKVDFLAGMEISITRMLVSQFTQVLVSRGEFVFRFGDCGSDMFFVFTGILDVLLPIQLAKRSRPTFRAVADTIASKDNASSQGGPTPEDIDSSWQQINIPGQLKKMNEISAGRYFGENGLFTNGERDAHIQARTSCILYRLSRESLELVFERYPRWKEKVIQIANIHREQARLEQLSREEQRRGMLVGGGRALSRSDIVNERAEGLKGARYHPRLQRSNTGSSSRILPIPTSTGLADQQAQKPLLRLVDGFLHGVPVQSNFHHFWLRFIICCTMFVAVMTPYQLTMDAMDRTAVVPILVIIIGIFCEVAFVVDLWFSWHVHESQASMELYDQKLRSVYKKERMLWDILAAIPFFDVLAVLGCSPWFKLLRCIKLFNLSSYFNELNRRSISNKLAFGTVWMGYLLAIYWVACAYLAVSIHAGFGAEWGGWLPSQELVISDPQNPSSSQLALRLLRGLFFAMVTFVKKAYCPEPETATLYAFHIGMSFVGLVTLSYVIGELASLFISYIGLEVGFRKNYIAVELYMARLRLSDRLKTRTYAFMTSLWSSHAGVNYEELLAEMPKAIRTSCVLQVSTKPLSWFIMKVIAPVCWEESQRMDEFTRALADRLRFECYPRDESVVTEGSIVRAMYFVIKGHLSMQSRSLLDRPVGLRSGSYFGERGLLGCTISAYTVRTVRACDLLSLSSEAFVQVLQGHLFTRLALKICDRAYKHLKGQRIASCSRTDMEEHWGAALLKVVLAIQAKRHPAAQPNLPVAKEADGKEASDPPPSSDRIPLSSLRRKVTTRQNSKAPEKQDHLLQNGRNDSASAGEAKGVRIADKESDELPANIEVMFKALKTPHSCFEAFAPLLHIMLATDPLEWHASFNTLNSTALPIAMGLADNSGCWRRNSPPATEHAIASPLISRNEEIEQ